MDRQAGDFGTFAKVPSHLNLLLQMRNHRKPILPLPLQCNAIRTYLSVGGSLLKPSRFGDSFALRILHPSIGGKQKLFVRRFVKGYSDESNEALIPFLQNSRMFLWESA